MDSNNNSYSFHELRSSSNFSKAFWIELFYLCSRELLIMSSPFSMNVLLDSPALSASWKVIWFWKLVAIWIMRLRTSFAFKFSRNWESSKYSRNRNQYFPHNNEYPPSFKTLKHFISRVCFMENNFSSNHHIRIQIFKIYIETSISQLSLLHYSVIGINFVSFLSIFNINQTWSDKVCDD